MTVQKSGDLPVTYLYASNWNQANRMLCCLALSVFKSSISPNEMTRYVVCNCPPEQHLEASSALMPLSAE